tara:strand:- start:349 stop:1041 length:693 start_codon:yes stop_codon:yes gene_type:complete
MSKIKLKHASGNSMSIEAPATNPASDLALKLPATIGTAGQVLKNSSTAGTLEFGSAGGDYVKLATESSGTDVSTIVHDSIDFSVYRALNFIGAVIPTSDNQPFNFYWRSGGADCVADTYFTGYHRAIPSDTEDTEAEFNQGRLQLCGNTGNADSQGFYFNIFMFPFASGDENNMGNFITWSGMHRDGSGNYRGIQGAGRYMTDVTPDGFKFQAHSGDIDHYNYSLYGIKR